MSSKRIRDLTNRGDNLKISISGIRGRIPAGLDPENIVAFTSAFSSITGSKIVIGYDSRSTGPILLHLAVGVLLASGKEVVNIGLAPTPTVKAAVKLLGAHAGIMISASHNPPEWNAFKFIGPGGFFFDQKMFSRLNTAMEKSLFKPCDYKRVGELREQDATALHIESILNSLPDIERIRKRRFRVALDAVAGAGREALPRLLNELGCEVIPLYCEATANGSFPRPPEPTPAALKKLSALVKKEKVDLGFALDPDADRLVLATPGFGAIPEEYTLPFAFMGTRHYQSPRSAPGRLLVVNLSTANLLERAVVSKGFRVIRSAVGEANVVELMRKKKAIFGGEGNGGVIDPELPSFGRDALAGAALSLSALVENNLSSDELYQSLPPLYMKKLKMPIGKTNTAQLFKKLKSKFSGSHIDNSDGLHLQITTDSWLHARESNTEPAVRIIAQADSASELSQILKEVAALQS